MKRKMQVLAGCLLLALAPAAYAQAAPGGELDTQVRVIDNTAANRGQAQVATRIASSFNNLAGSEENALALVRSLREGSTVRLTTTVAPTGTQTEPTTTTTSFTPATGRMGWGNVRISLALAQDALLRAGITKPTAEQLQAALNGGEITGADGKAVTLSGVLQMRADGMGWGQIAQAGGTKVGPVISSLKSTQAQLARLPATGTGGDTSTVTTAAGGGKSKAITAEGGGKPKGVTTAGDSAPKGRGVTTADGSSTATHGKGASKGITTAAGGAATSSPKGPSKGITTASGATSTASSRGLVTADGAAAGHAPKGNAHGRGIVSASGGGATNVGAATSGRGHGGGAGVVNASGSPAGSVSTAQGGSRADPGKGNGKGRGGGG